MPWTTKPIYHTIPPTGDWCTFKWGLELILPSVWPGKTMIYAPVICCLYSDPALQTTVAPAQDPLGRYVPSGSWTVPQLDTSLLSHSQACARKTFTRWYSHTAIDYNTQKYRRIEPPLNLSDMHKSWRRANLWPIHKLGQELPEEIQIDYAVMAFLCLWLTLTKVEPSASNFALGANCGNYNSGYAKYETLWRGIQSLLWSHFAILNEDISAGTFYSLYGLVRMLFRGQLVAKRSERCISLSVPSYLYILGYHLA